MQKLNLITNNKPVLLLSPLANADVISQQMLSLIGELMAGITSIEPSEASSATVKRVVRLCQKGITRLMGLAGSCQVLSTDSLKAEQHINNAIAELAGTLNCFALELKTRSAYGENELLDYLETLDGLVGLLTSVLPMAEPPAHSAEVELEFEQYL